jgi:hypothetical protein
VVLRLLKFAPWQTSIGVHELAIYVMCRSRHTRATLVSQNDWPIPGGTRRPKSTAMPTLRRFRRDVLLAPGYLYVVTAWSLLAILPTFATARRAADAIRTIKLPVIDGTDIQFRRLSIGAGLSQARVSQIVQDDQGFLWFGTQYGLNRYDGYEFKVFKHDPGHRESLSRVFIYSLFKDRSGTLWVGTDQSLDRFDSNTETFTHYTLGNAEPNGVPIIVINISQDHRGLLWLSTYDGLYSLNPAIEL